MNDEDTLSLSSTSTSSSEAPTPPPRFSSLQRSREQSQAALARPPVPRKMVPTISRPHHHHHQHHQSAIPSQAAANNVNNSSSTSQVARQSLEMKEHGKNKQLIQAVDEDEEECEIRKKRPRSGRQLRASGGYSEEEGAFCDSGAEFEEEEEAEWQSASTNRTGPPLELVVDEWGSHTLLDPINQQPPSSGKQQSMNEHCSLDLFASDQLELLGLDWADENYCEGVVTGNRIFDQNDECCCECTNNKSKGTPDYKAGELLSVRSEDGASLMLGWPEADNSNGLMGVSAESAEQPNDELVNFWPLVELHENPMNSLGDANLCREIVEEKEAEDESRLANDFGPNHDGRESSLASAREEQEEKEKEKEEQEALATLERSRLLSLCDGQRENRAAIRLISSDSVQLLVLLMMQEQQNHSCQQAEHQQQQQQSQRPPKFDLEAAKEAEELLLKLRNQNTSEQSRVDNIKLEASKKERADRKTKQSQATSQRRAKEEGEDEQEEEENNDIKWLASATNSNPVAARDQRSETKIGVRGAAGATSIAPAVLSTCSINKQLADRNKTFMEQERQQQQQAVGKQNLQNVNHFERMEPLLERNSIDPELEPEAVRRRVGRSSEHQQLSSSSSSSSSSSASSASGSNSSRWLELRAESEPTEFEQQQQFKQRQSHSDLLQLVRLKQQQQQQQVAVNSASGRAQGLPTLKELQAQIQQDRMRREDSQQQQQRMHQWTAASAAMVQEQQQQRQQQQQQLPVDAAAAAVEQIRRSNNNATASASSANVSCSAQVANAVALAAADAPPASTLLELKMEQEPVEGKKEGEEEEASATATNSIASSLSPSLKNNKFTYNPSTIRTNHELTTTSFNNNKQNGRSQSEQLDKTTRQPQQTLLTTAHSCQLAGLNMSTNQATTTCPTTKPIPQPRQQLQYTTNLPLSQINESSPQHHQLPTTNHPKQLQELSILTNTTSTCHLSARLKDHLSGSSGANSISSPSHSILSDSTTLITEAAMNSSELIPKLIERLDRKLIVMKEEQLTLMREIELNETTGQRLFDSMKHHLTVNEFEKISLHANEIEKVTKLILSLKLRLKRVEAELKERASADLKSRARLESCQQQQDHNEDNNNNNNNKASQQQQLSSKTLEMKVSSSVNQLPNVRGISDPTSTTGLPKRNHQHHASLQLSSQQSASGSVTLPEKNHAVQGSEHEDRCSALADRRLFSSTPLKQLSAINEPRLLKHHQHQISLTNSSCSGVSPRDSGSSCSCSEGPTGHTVHSVSCSVVRSESNEEEPTGTKTNASSSSDSIFNCADSAIGSTLTGHGGSVTNMEQQPATISQSSLSSSSASSTHSSLASSASHSNHHHHHHHHRQHQHHLNSPSQSHLSSNISVSSHSSMSSVPNSPQLMSPASTTLSSGTGSTAPSSASTAALQAAPAPTKLQQQATSVSSLFKSDSNNNNNNTTTFTTANSGSTGDSTASDFSLMHNLLTDTDILIAKRNKLVSQLEEAHQLEECIVHRNNIIIQRILKKYYGDDSSEGGEIAEFKQFTRLKSLLLKDTNDIADRINNAELQLNELKHSNQCNP